MNMDSSTCNVDRHHIYQKFVFVGYASSGCDRSDSQSRSKISCAASRRATWLVLKLVPAVFQKYLAETSETGHEGFPIIFQTCTQMIVRSNLEQCITHPQAMLLVPTFSRLSVTMYFAWLTLEYGGYAALGPSVWFHPGTSNSLTSSEPVPPGPHLGKYAGACGAEQIELAAA